MAKRKLWLGLLTGLLVFGMALTGCENDDTKKESGTFQIKITGIALDIMGALGDNGAEAYLLMANTINLSDGDFNPYALLAGWDYEECPADEGEDSLTFKFYKMDAYPLKEYTGEAGNYDIVFGCGGVEAFIKNKKLEVNKLNVIAFSSLTVLGE